MAFRSPPRNPIDAFIRELGGPSALARELGLRPSTVSGWQLSGRIPKWRVGSVAEVALREGKPWPMDGADEVAPSSIQPAEAPRKAA